MVNDHPLIPATIDTAKKLEDYVKEFKSSSELSNQQAEFWQAVRNRLNQFVSYYTSRDDIELKRDEPNFEGFDEFDEGLSG